MVFGVDDLLLLGVGLAIHATARHFYEKGEHRAVVTAEQGPSGDVAMEARPSAQPAQVDCVPKQTRKSQQDALYRKFAVSDSTIRLLILKPDDGSNGPVECSFKVQKMALKMDHEALSYHWGEHTHNKEVYIDNVPFDVTDNLWNALNNFRGGMGDPERIMWVDALCINQDEKASEKNQEILAMFMIYGFARGVKVWLDNSTRHSDAVFDHFQPLDGPSPLSLSDETLMGFYLKEGADMWHKLLREFLRSKWWTRAWIVQEVMLAKNPVVHRGSRSLSFELLVRLSSFLVKFHLDPDFNEKISLASARSRTRLQMSVYRSRYHSGIPISLGDWVAQFHNQEATNPRDLVYGFLGLAPSCRNLSSKLVPQYKLPLENVYAQGVQYIIEESMSLDFICLGRGPERGSPEEVHKPDFEQKVTIPVDLPSWVPDLRVKDFSGTVLRRPLLLNYGSIANGSNLVNGALVPSVFNASDLAFCGRFYATSMVLECSGVQVDVIATLTSSLCIVNEDFATDYTNGSATRTFVRDAEKLFEETALAKSGDESTSIQAMTQLYPVLSTQHTYLQAFQKTMMLDLHKDGSRLKPHEGFGAFPLVPPADFLPKEPNQQVRLNDWKLHLHADQYNWSAGRRFFTTDKGYLGIANWDARVGDVICVLEGASVPFVMRKRDTACRRWEFVGETYLHGFMDGECRKMGLPIEEFTIV